MKPQVQMWILFLTLYSNFFNMYFAGSTGVGFTPHVITVQVGEVCSQFPISPSINVIPDEIILLL